MAKPQKASEMKALSVEELTRRAGELRESLFNLRLKLRTGAVESPAEIGKSRKELARVLTVLRQKQQAAQAEAPKS